MLREKAQLLRHEIRHLVDQRKAADPTASDPQLQMLTRLEERLSWNNHLANSTVNMLTALTDQGPSPKPARGTALGGDLDSQLMARMGVLEAKVDAYAARARDGQRAVERAVAALGRRDAHGAAAPPKTTHVIVCHFKLTTKLGVQLNSGNVIQRIDKGGLAHREGSLRPGDRIVTVNNQDCTATSIHSLIADYVGRDVTFVALRDS